MQTTGTLWKSLQRGNFQAEFKFEIAGQIYGHEAVASATVTQSLFETLSIGNACSAELSMTFRPAGAIPAAAEIKVFVRLKNSKRLIVVRDEFGNVVKTDDGYVLASSYPDETEWLPFGVFFIDTRKTDRFGWMTITAYDAMLMAEQEYWDNSGTYPMTMANAVNVICRKLGLTQDSRNQIAAYSIDYPAGVYTMREVLGSIAAASGGNFIISPAGALRLVQLTAPRQEAEVVCADYEKGDLQTIGAVTLYPDSDTQYASGSGGYAVAGNCIYATQAMTNAVQRLLAGATYLPMTANSVLLDPAAELGDGISIDGELVTLSQVNWTLGPAVSADCTSAIEAEIEHEYPYQTKDEKEQRRTARAISEIRKSTEEIALEVSGKVDETEVSSMIQTGIEGITLSAKAGENQSTISIKAGGVTFDTAVVKFSNIVANEVSADNIVGNLTSGQIDLYGDMTVYKNSRLTTAGGSIGYTPSTLDGAGGIHLLNDDGDCEVRVTTNGAAVESGSSSFVAASNATISSNNAVRLLGDGGCYSNGETITSDRRLKNRIDYQEPGQAAAILDELKPCSFYYNEWQKDKKHFGFVAQDVIELLKKYGYAEKSVIVGQDPETEMFALAYTEFIPLLVAKIQQMDAKLREMEEKLNG